MARSDLLQYQRVGPWLRRGALRARRLRLLRGQRRLRMHTRTSSCSPPLMKLLRATTSAELSGRQPPPACSKCQPQYGHAQVHHKVISQKRVLQGLTMEIANKAVADCGESGELGTGMEGGLQTPTLPFLASSNSVKTWRRFTARQVLDQCPLQDIKHTKQTAGKNNEQQTQCNKLQQPLFTCCRT